ncbi:MAG TPA: lysozyme inhibitor LprI family protein [Novosphingobium sp.]|nr:lysozyme inhibitor LprI family protein [Novosphingobium sp.]
MSPPLIRQGGKITFCLIAMLHFSQAAAHPDATGAQYSKNFDTCASHAEGSYTRIIHCLSDEQSRQERVLNSVYRNVSHDLSAAPRQTLRLSERSWILAREGKCPLTDVAGLSEEVDMRMCRLDQTVRRIDYLKQYKPHP